MQFLLMLRTNLSRRPIWMNAIMFFCIYMALVYVPWDFLFKPVAEDQEVWFGILFTGWAAKLTEPLHWAIYAAGAWGFWHMKSWLHPWVALYVVQIAIGMFVWGLLDERGPGLLGASLTAIPFLVLAAFLWRAKHRFGNSSQAVPQPEKASQ